jgi:hypothetical protein
MAVEGLQREVRGALALAYAAGGQGAVAAHLERDERQQPADDDKDSDLPPL